MPSLVIVIAVVLFIICSLYREWFQPAITFLIGVLVLGLFGILDGQEMLLGFSDPQIVSILLLIVFGNLLGDSSILDVMFSKLFSTTRAYKGFMAKLLPAVTIVSSVVNNTPIVALLIPHVYKWSRSNKVALSKLLIPLSYSAILGGTITLVGTSTNMLVNAFAIKNSDVSFSILDFAYVGIPVSIVGLLYIIFLGNKLLPIRSSLTESFSEHSREYLVEAQVMPQSSYIGQSLKQANLRQLNGLYVVEIYRQNQSIAPVSPDEKLEANDLLILAGNVEAISDLIDNNVDLVIPQATDNTSKALFDVVEVVVAPGSYLINKRIKHSDFRSRYDAAVVAINRRGKNLKGQIGEQLLHAGDTLLLLTGKDYANKQSTASDFYQISKLKEVRPLNVKQSMVIGGGLLLSILLAAFNILSLFKALLILLLISLIFRILTYNKLNKYLDYNLLIMAALALSLGIAIEKTGLAANLAHFIVAHTTYFGIVGTLIGLYSLTFVFTELMTNIAAASLALPFSLAIATEMGVSPEPFFLIVAYAASASFITPLGYQTNLMIYGPGGYQFKDFLKFGLPLSILYMIFAIGIIYWRYF